MNANFSINKHCFDMEYNTQIKSEFEFLKEHGIEPSFTKKNFNNITVYKYTKTPDLFRLVAEFYEDRLKTKENDLNGRNSKKEESDKETV